MQRVDQVRRCIARQGRSARSASISVLFCLQVSHVRLVPVNWCREEAGLVIEKGLGVTTKAQSVHSKLVSSGSDEQRNQGSIGRAAEESQALSERHRHGVARERGLRRIGIDFMRTSSKNSSPRSPSRKASHPRGSNSKLAASIQTPLAWLCGINLEERLGTCPELQHLYHRYIQDRDRCMPEHHGHAWLA